MVERTVTCVWRKSAVLSGCYREHNCPLGTEFKGQRRYVKGSLRSKSGLCLLLMARSEQIRGFDLRVLFTNEPAVVHLKCPFKSATWKQDLLLLKPIESRRLTLKGFARFLWSGGKKKCYRGNRQSLKCHLRPFF